LVKLDVKEGIRSDQGYRDHLATANLEDLFIFDLGYFVPSVFETLEASGAYFICRYKADTNIYDVKTQQKIDLLHCLKSKTFLEKEILLGREAKLKLRIIGKKLASEASAARRRKANDLAKSRRL
jgi:hypothetical protein